MLLLGVQNDPIVGNEGVAAGRGHRDQRGHRPASGVIWQGIGHGAEHLLGRARWPPVIGYLDSGNLPATDTYCPA